MVSGLLFFEEQLKSFTIGQSFVSERALICVIAEITGNAQ